jgi:hypothetical protein
VYHREQLAYRRGSTAIHYGPSDSALIPRDKVSLQSLAATHGATFVAEYPRLRSCT